MFQTSRLPTLARNPYLRREKSIIWPSKAIETVTTDTQLVNNNSSTAKMPYKIKPDYCYFCESIIQNFVRHIRRNHSTELEVQGILSKPTRSKERRNLLDKLRRKGNFLASGCDKGHSKVVKNRMTHLKFYIVIEKNAIRAMLFVTLRLPARQKWSSIPK